jgi:hypothetical protein
MSRFSEILEWLRRTFSCASGPSRLEQEQLCLKTKHKIEQRREDKPKILKARIANYTAQLEKIQEDDNKTKQLEEIKLIMEDELQGKSDLKIIPKSHNKGQEPLPPINTDGNVFAEAFKKATQIPTSHNKGQEPLPPINTVNNKRQDKLTQIPTSHNKGQEPLAPNTGVNVFAEAYKKAAENQTSKADQTASTLLR